MFGSRSWAFGLFLPQLFLTLSAGVGCASPVAKPAAPPPSAETDAKAVLQQELGEVPSPQGPCPERTEANVLSNPRATVQRTALGLAYCFLQEGPSGLTVPAPTDTVRVHYSGWTEEGKLFDSSVDRGQPLDLALNAVIRGWSEGLRLMTPGDKARLWIPGNLGYGRKEPGQDAGTPPKGTIIFDVELLDVKREETAPLAMPADPDAPPPRDESKPNLAPKPLPPAELTMGQMVGHAKKPKPPPKKED